LPSLSAATAQPALERVTDVDAVLPAWSQLARRSGNLFATPEWLLRWWRHFGQGEMQLWLAADGGTPRALLPLYLDGAELRFLGHGQGDELGPVAAPADRRWAARALGRLLARPEIAWRSFEGRDLPGEVPWTELTGAEVTERTSSPVLRLEGLDWERFLASRGRNFRAQARARERRLAARGGRVRLADDPARLDGDLDVLFSLHQARWGRHARELVERSGAFHRDFAAAALKRGWLRLRLLELQGRPAAALLSYRFGDEEWFYQGGRDPAFDREAPGLTLHLYAIRSALHDGLRAYRFLRGDEPYKRRFADHDAPVVTVHRQR
jgi:CelD/BcsL family acetyltransferase involved in cellulose biosynthesis